MRNLFADWPLASAWQREESSSAYLGSDGWFGDGAARCGARRAAELSPRGNADRERGTRSARSMPARENRLYESVRSIRI